MSSGVVLTLWTNEVETARRADAAGIDRIGVDLDQIGKATRQAGLGTWISPHSLDDLDALRPAVSRGALFARVNPLNHGTAGEVEGALRAGARVLMLPMFRSAKEIEEFIAVVGGRAPVVGLLETTDALDDIDSVVRVSGLDELHVGINDLALDLGLNNRFEVLVGGEIERVASAAASANLPLGVGGIGRLGDVELPIAPDLVYAQYARLGATAALVSRSFLAGDRDLTAEIRRARERLAWWTTRPPAELARARRELSAAAATAGSF